MTSGTQNYGHHKYFEIQYTCAYMDIKIMMTSRKIRRKVFHTNIDDIIKGIVTILSCKLNSMEGKLNFKQSSKISLSSY